MILAYTLIYKDYFFSAIALCTKFRPSFSRIPLSFRGGLHIPKRIRISEGATTRLVWLKFLSVHFAQAKAWRAQHQRAD